MNYTLLSSPLQGFTDFRFRNAQNKIFGGIDTFYAPYIRLNGKMVIKSSYQRDLLPENNNTLEVIPQIITNDADEFLFVSKYVQELGYKELNWNLGCPYPMVTKCGMGSGLISNTEKINQILHKVHNESDIIVSMKMRLGYDTTEEILGCFPYFRKIFCEKCGNTRKIRKTIVQRWGAFRCFSNLRRSKQGQTLLQWRHHLSSQVSRNANALPNC